MFPHKLRQDFGVGFRFERYAFLFKLLLKDRVIFNDPVVDQGDFIAIIGVRVSVGVRGRAVGSPAGVGNTNGPLFIFFPHHCLKTIHLAFIFIDVHFFVVDNGDPRAVVAAILKGGETFDEDGVGFSVTDVSDDSAHDDILWKNLYAVKRNGDCR